MFNCQVELLVAVVDMALLVIDARKVRDKICKYSLKKRFDNAQFRFFDK